MENNNEIEKVSDSKEEIELKEEIKQNRKIDISLFLSIAALIVATLQFLVSTPFFSEYYYKANFEITEQYPYVTGKTINTAYTVKNLSKNTVNNVEISIQMLTGAKIQTIPEQNIQYTFKDNGPLLKNCFLSINKLVPSETFVIIILSDLDSTIYYNTTFIKNRTLIPNELKEKDNYKLDDTLDYFAFPSISYAKFEKGFGKINPMPIGNILSKLNKLNSPTK